MKTLIQQVPDLNQQYLSPINPQHPVTTHGNIYHGRMGAAHDQVYKTILQSYLVQDATEHDKKIATVTALINRVQNNGPLLTALKGKIGLLGKMQIDLLLNNNTCEEKKLEILQQIKEKLEKQKQENQGIQHIHNKKLSDDSVNFGVAEVVFIVTTKHPVTNEVVTRLAISFPVNATTTQGENTPTFNYKNLPGEKAIFKKACQAYQVKSQKILEDKKLQLEGQAIQLNYETCHEQYFPQKAYHSEKFFFYHLINGGLAKIVNHFKTKSMTPATVFSIDSMELRIHSTRDICDSCEALSIGAKQILMEHFNNLLVENHFQPLSQSFTVALSMSYNINERIAKIEQNFVDLKSVDAAKLQPIPPKQPILQFSAHRYTYFESAGESDASTAKKERAVHLNAIKAVQADSFKQANKLEEDAGLKILYYMRKHHKKVKKPNLSQ